MHQRTQQLTLQRPVSPSSKNAKIIDDFAGPRPWIADKVDKSATARPRSPPPSASNRPAREHNLTRGFDAQHNSQRFCGRQRTRAAPLTRSLVLGQFRNPDLVRHFSVSVAASTVP
jgi:hypothetical protein